MKTFKFRCLFLAVLICASISYAEQKGGGGSDERWAGRPEAASAGRKEDITRNFAVVGFPTIAQGTDNDWLGIGLGEDLATWLSQVDGTFAVERLQLNLVLAAAKVNMLTERVSEAKQADKREEERLVTLSKVIKGGRMVAADYMIVGSLWMVGKFGEKSTVLRANVRVVRTETGEVLEAVRAEGSGDQKGYMRLEEDLAEALAERMGIPEEKRVKVTELRHRAITGDAYEAFVKATILNIRQLKQMMGDVPI
jgi:TolB-like protein